MNHPFPYGRPHLDAPKEIADFEPMIGICDCKSVSRIDQNTWADTVSMTWTFKYIMNGWGVQDMMLKEDEGHSGSIRVFNADSVRIVPDGPLLINYLGASPRGMNSAKN